jgi:uncharacterized protein YjbI with pentapeptide repeats
LSKVNLGYIEADEGTLYLSRVSKVLSRPQGTNRIFGVYIDKVDILQEDILQEVETAAPLGEVKITGSNIPHADIRSFAIGSVGRVRVTAKLHDADLTNADLREANLTNAAGVTIARLHQQAFSLRGATMPDGQGFEQWLEAKGRSGEDSENADPS